MKILTFIKPMGRHPLLLTRRFFVFMKQSDYILIQSWMVSELKLSGNELLLFALIHGFSKDGVNRFRGSISYVSSFLSISKKTVVNLYSKLLEKGLISKEDNVNGNYYYSNTHIDSVKVTQPSSVKVTQGVCKNYTGGSVKITHTNNNTNNHNNKKSIKIDFNGLLDFINKTQKREGNEKFTVINKTVQAKYNARLKDGYTKEHIINAINNVANDEFHKNNNYKYANAEYFSRAKTLDTYGINTNNKKIKEPEANEFDTLKNGGFVNF